MPLLKGNSKATVSKNISEFHTGKTYAHTAAKFGKSRADKQAIAVALNTARRYGKKYADGGDVDDDDTQTDPLTGAVTNPNEKVQGKFGRIMDALGGGLKSAVEFPGRYMEAQKPEQEGSVTEGDVMRQDASHQQAADWSAGTAMSMVGMGRLPGAAPEGSIGIGGGKLKQPQGRGLSQEQEDALMASLNEVLSNPNKKAMLSPEHHEALNSLAQEWGIQGAPAPAAEAAGMPVHKTITQTMLADLVDGTKPKDVAKYLVDFAKQGDFETALMAKDALPKQAKSDINKALWALTKEKGVEPETLEAINNLYSSKIAAKSQAEPRYKSAKDYTDADIAEYNAMQHSQEAHEEAVSKGGSYDDMVAPHLASHDPAVWVDAAKTASKPIHNWVEWKPPESHEVSEQVKNFTPNWKQKIKELGFNPEFTVFKGGYSMDPVGQWDKKFTGKLPNPKNKELYHSDERAWFAGDKESVAKAYLKGEHKDPDQYLVRAPKAIEVDWNKFYGMNNYSPEAMQKLIDAGHHMGVDLLVIHNINDIGGSLQTQYAILNTKGTVRGPQAKFDPEKLHPAHPDADHVLAGVAGGTLFTYGALQGNKGNEDGKMNRGGRTPKMAGGGSNFNPMKWVPRPPNLSSNIRPVGGGMPRPASPPRPVSTGMIKSAVPGRTDSLPMNVKGGSYVVPASVVSGMAQGNSMAGADALNKLFKQGPYGDAQKSFGTPKPNFGKPMGAIRPPMAVRPPKMTGAKAGGVETAPNPVPIIAAGGEYIVSPEAVRRLGGGDLKHGHEILDEFVKHIRRQTIKDMQKEKAPKR